MLDHDPDQIELLRKFGFKRVLRRRDPARSAARRGRGARPALLVNAIDDVDASIALVEIVREHFPNLPSWRAPAT